MMSYSLYVTAPDLSIEEAIYTRRPSDLQPASSLPGWHAARGEPDVRGWVAFQPDDWIPLGSVEDVLVSIGMARAIFIVIYTGDAIGESYVDFGVDPNLNRRHIPIPIDQTELDVPDRRVLINCSLGQLSDAPEYEPGTADLDKYYDYWQRA